MVKIVLGAVLLTLCAIAVVTMGTPKGLASPSSMTPLPDPGTYLIDPVHTFAYFGASHHIVGLLWGRFDKVTGTISAAKDPADCVSIGTASIDTQVARRDEDLRGPDFFDVKNFPAMTYRGRGIRKSAGDTWVMDGLLTIRGVTKEVPLTFRFKGLFPGMPAGQPARTSFLASAVLYPPSPPYPAQQSGVQVCSACRPHHRHRRKYQHLQRRRQGPPTAPPLPKPAEHGPTRTEVSDWRLIHGLNS